MLPNLPRTINKNIDDLSNPSNKILVTSLLIGIMFVVYAIVKVQVANNEEYKIQNKMKDSIINYLVNDQLKSSQLDKDYYKGIIHFQDSVILHNQDIQRHVSNRKK